MGDPDAVAAASGEGLDGGEEKGGQGRGEERGRERMKEDFGVSVWL